MITIKLKYDVNQEYQSLIQKYQRQYSSMLHVFYQQLSKETELQPEYSYLKSDSILKQKFKQLNNIDLMNDWFCRSAIGEAYQLLKSNKDEEGNKTKVIFGGKRNFIRRCKGLITREQFLNNKKLNPIYSIGTCKPYKGNQKFEIKEDLETIIFKPDRQTHIELKLHLQNYKQKLKKLYLRQQSKDLPITYKLDQNYVYISYEEDKLESVKYKQIENRVLALDLNPNYIGWSIVDWKSEKEFKVIKSGIYSIKDLNDKDLKLKKKKLKSSSPKKIYLTNKRNHEILEIAKNIINKAIYYKCQIVSIEDLKIKSDDKNKGKKFNKLVNNLWNRNALVNNLQKRCNIFNIKLIKVKPEYSSFIGNFLYRGLNLPDMILASIELSRRAYEYYNQYISRTKEQKKNIIQPDIKLFNDLIIKSLEEFNIQREQFKDLKELYYIFKKSKMLYRLSINQFNLQFSRFFTSKSYMKIANFE